jgi:hypothetical protein
MDEPTKPASGKEALKRESPDEERLLVVKEYISNLQEPPQEPALRQLRSYRVRPQLD